MAIDLSKSDWFDICNYFYVSECFSNGWSVSRVALSWRISKKLNLNIYDAVEQARDGTKSLAASEEQQGWMLYADEFVFDSVLAYFDASCVPLELD